jgi:hypothetical protein
VRAEHCNRRALNGGQSRARAPTWKTNKFYSECYRFLYCEFSTVRLETRRNITRVLRPHGRHLKTRTNMVSRCRVLELSPVTSKHVQCSVVQ